MAVVDVPPPGSIETRPSPSGEHPVWDVYDLLRTARLNVKYYQGRIRSLKRRQFWLDVVLGVSAPTSAVAGLWFVDTPAGQNVWQVFMATAAVVAVVRPLLKYGDTAQAMQEAVAAYKGLDHDLYCLAVDIRAEKSF